MTEPTKLWNNDRLRMEIEAATAYRVARVKCLSQSGAHILLVAMRADYERRIGELQRFVEQLEAAADPQALDIVYGKGRADEQEKCRARIAELETALDEIAQSEREAWQYVEDLQASAARVPDDVRAAIEHCLDHLCSVFDDDANNMPDALYDSYITVRAWLAEQEANDAQ